MTVGVLGLGAMGTPMAWNLHDAGLLGAVHNRTRSKTDLFVEAGVPASETSAGLARRVDVSLLMVTDDEALTDVLDGPDGVLHGMDDGHIVVNASTVSIEATKRAASAVDAAGGRFVDAPVSGTVGPAEDGTLTVLAAGADDDLNAVAPVLNAVGDPVVRCGAVGDGTRTKLFVNLLLGNLLQGYAEALVFGRKQGLSFEFMQDVLERSPMHADLLDYKGSALEDRDFTKQFPVDLLLKDLNLITEAAQEAGVYLPQTAATREAVGGASAQGHGDEDMIAVIKLLEAVADVTVEPEASADGS
jgi:3-hydroxyisobutyrate dehydrogenase/2-hydroxy-3-oxopropionate reductase